MDADKFYSVGETARFYGVSDSTIRRRIRAGKLRAYRLGDSDHNLLRIRATDIARLVHEKERVS